MDRGPTKEDKTGKVQDSFIKVADRTSKVEDSFLKTQVRTISHS